MTIPESMLELVPALAEILDFAEQSKKANKARKASRTSRMAAETSRAR
jgi:hypothetical protein